MRFKQYLEEQFLTDRVAIQTFLDENEITDATIHTNGVVDVNGRVIVKGKLFNKLPVKFGKISRYFQIEYCPNLLSFDGFPDETYSLHIKACNNLTSFAGLDIEIDGVLEIEYCNSLTSLEGIHEHIKRLGGRGASCGELKIDASSIKRGGIATLLIPGHPFISTTRLLNSGPRGVEAFRTIAKYLRTSDASSHIFECQTELIEEGLEEYAQL